MQQTNQWIKVEPIGVHVERMKREYKGDSDAQYEIRKWATTRDSDKPVLSMYDIGKVYGTVEYRLDGSYGQMDVDDLEEMLRAQGWRKLWDGHDRNARERGMLTPAEVKKMQAECQAGFRGQAMIYTV